MKISVQTGSIFQKMSIEESFKLFSEAGFDGVDFNINTDYPSRDIAAGKPSELFERDDEDILEFYRPYKETAAKYNIEFSQAHAPFPTYVQNDLGNEYVLNAIRKSIMVCGYLDCPYIVVHPNFLGYNEMLTPEQEWAVNIERFSALIEDAKKYRVTICLENMFIVRQSRIYGAICSEMSETNRYIDALNEIAGEKVFAFCLDTGHALLSSKEMYSAIMALGPRLEVLHLHDNDGARDQHLFPYMGILDWDRCLKGLKDAGYQGVLSFETEGGLNAFEPSLAPECLKLLAATGRMFARKLEG